MPRKPNITIKKQKTSMGLAYRIYIDGMYMGAAFTHAGARDGAKRMLKVYERIKQKEDRDSHTSGTL